MNFCCRCQSMYSQPGTCNCYAGTQPVPALPVYPTTPTIPGTYPWTGDPWWYWGNTCTSDKIEIRDGSATTTNRPVPVTLTFT